MKTTSRLDTVSLRSVKESSDGSQRSRSRRAKGHHDKLRIHNDITCWVEAHSRYIIMRNPLSHHRLTPAHRFVQCPWRVDDHRPGSTRRRLNPPHLLHLPLIVFLHRLLDRLGRFRDDDVEVLCISFSVEKNTRVVGRTLPVHAATIHESAGAEAHESKSGVAWTHSTFNFLWLGWVNEPFLR